jgi:hypothetical protein
MRIRILIFLFDADPDPDPSFKKRLKPSKKCYNRLIFHTFWLGADPDFILTNTTRIRIHNTALETDLLNYQKPPHMDGESILRTLYKDGKEPATPWRSSFLLERGKMTFQRYAKVRIVHNTYLVSFRKRYRTPLC